MSVITKMKPGILPENFILSTYVSHGEFFLTVKNELLAVPRAKTKGERRWPLLNSGRNSGRNTGQRLTNRITRAHPNPSQLVDGQLIAFRGGTPSLLG